MSDLSNRTLTIEKTFNAPVQLVWDAWTQSEHILKWWAPNGMDLKVIEHDFKVGGKWKYTMQMPDGTEFISEGAYTEIVELEKIVTSADFKPMTENVELQAYFEAVGEKTKFTFNVVHATPEYCKQQEEMGFYNGWGSAFERLVKHLEVLVK
ncbi:SRPBCC domain-containing protein [Flavivirga algicola]|uniref:Activator of HSP90 ATPase n=1 Tax=Flavivirga algicola TaxID=2729136 RepID=A0ABX1S1C4_9FLAO|nr:SRPBCC domain-containing protein [Flavivirga algicola]NMH88683.1 activator of HSP90 ATPase [Flavivirga algicola]